MNIEENCCGSKNRNQSQKANATGGAVYGLGLIGAAIYFISQAATFWLGVLGFLKALVWPAYLVYYALKALGVH
jgi:hypothetical protein